MQVNPNATVATQQWKESTRVCNRNLVIKRIAIAALIILAVGMVTAAIVLATPIGLTEFVVIVVLPIVALSLISGAVVTFTISMGIWAHIRNTPKYGDPKKAKEIVDKIKTSPVITDEFWLDIPSLAKYGFMTQIRANELMRLRMNYQLNRDAFRDYLQNEVIPNLPSP